MIFLFPVPPINYANPQTVNCHSSFENSQEICLLCKKPISIYTTQYPDLFAIYEKGYNMITGRTNYLKFPHKINNLPNFQAIIQREVHKR